MQDPIVIISYDPLWKEYFLSEKKRLEKIFPQKTIFEHIGSTSVTNLSSKPIIDILIGVDHLSTIDKNRIDTLQSMGYLYFPQYENHFKERRFFKKEKENVEDKKVGFHLHVVEKKSDFLKRHIAFRDLLREDEKIKKEYQELKIKLAKAALDIEEYIGAKGAFIREVMREKSQKDIEKLSTSDLSITFLDKKDEKTKEEVLRFLFPYEKYALFLLGNLGNKDFPSNYYIAKKEGKIVGVSGYFPTFKSASIFSLDPKASILLAEKMLENHTIQTFLGMRSTIQPTLESIKKKGYRIDHDRRTAFLELNIEDFSPFSKPFLEGEKIVEIKEKDIDQMVHLQRYLHNIPQEKPIEEGERKRIELSLDKYGVEKEGKIISSFISNGMIYETFQIIGVVTHPDHRGKGYARALLSFFIEKMKKNKKAKNVVLFTGYDNFAALKCYHALGFRITDEYYLANIEKS